MALLDYIKDQLLFNDVVTLPGLGSFELKRSPSRIQGSKIIPPSVSVIFDTDKSLDDGILANSIASGEEIAEDDARQKVLEYIDDILFALNKGEDYVFEGFGKLYRDPENVIRFEKDPAFRIEFGTNGLESFELDPIGEISESGAEETPDTGEEIPADKKEDRIIPPAEPEEKVVRSETPAEPLREEPETFATEENKSNRSIFWILTGAVMILLVSFVVLKMTTNILDGPMFIIFTKDVTDQPGDITGDDENWNLESALNGELGDAIDSMTKQENALALPEENKTEVLPAGDTAEYSEYHIIAGSFKDKVNASALQQELTESGYPARVIRQGDNLYRVSAISFRDKVTGLRELTRFKQKTKNNAAWLLGLNEN